MGHSLSSAEEVLQTHTIHQQKLEVGREGGEGRREGKEGREVSREGEEGRSKGGK